MQKTVLVGVTGCVAAYKSCEIVRGLQKAGVRVKVVMTEHACEFVQPAQFRALTREPVAVGLFDDAPGDPIHHISLSKEAERVVKLMPKWKPARQGNKNVRSRFNLPVMFKLQ